MSIKWGSWDYSSSNGMRIGVEGSAESVSHSESVCTFTFKFYTQNQYWYDDPQILDYSGVLGGLSDTSYTNDEGGGKTTLRATKTYNYTYSGSSYGSSPGSVTGGACVDNTYNDVEPCVTITIPIPARPYAGPAAPSNVVATRISDISGQVTWTRNATSAEPYSNQTLQRLDYSNGTTGPWVTIATVSGSATSYTDNSIKTNRAYKYQIRSNNSAGSSSYVASGWIYTTPSAPSSVLATMQTNGTSILVSWTRADYLSATNVFDIQRSVNAGAYATVATGVVGTAWTDSSPGAGSNRYQVRCTQTAPTLDLSSAYTISNLVSTVVAPLAPTQLAPNGITIDFSKDQTFTWKHNPAGDGAAQTVAQIDTSLNAGANWVTLATLTQNASSYLVPANALTNGINYQWRVRTQGVASAGYSPYSSPVATVTGRDQPTVTLDPTKPPPSLGTLPLIVAWAYNQGQGDLQTAWQAELYDSSNNLVEAAGASNNASSTTFGSALTNEGAYMVRVRAMSALGQWSEWASALFSVSLLPPANVITEIEMFDCTGSVGMILTAEDPVIDVSVPVDYVDVQRSINGGEWQTIMIHIEPPTSVLDLTPPTVGTVEYRLVITSITPSQAVGPVFAIEGEDMCDNASGQWIFVNYGTDFSNVLRFHGNPDVGSASGRVRAAQAFLGKTKPAMLLGENASYVINASGALHFGECCYAIDPGDDCLHDSPVTDWEIAGQNAGVVLYRDWTGRRLFGMLSDVSCTNPRPNFGTVGFSVTETEYEERIWTGELLPGAEAPFTNLYCGGSFEEGWPGTAGGSATVISDSAWASQGLLSVKITPNGTLNTSSAYPQGVGTNIGDAMRALGLEKGKTYTISADIRLTGVQTGTLDLNARTFGIIERRAGVGTAVLFSSPAPNAAGVYRLSTIYNVPTDAALQDVSIQLMNGSAVAAQPLWWDALMIEEGETGAVWSAGCITLPSNLFATNPSFELPYTGVTQGSATVGRSAAWSSQGDYCLKITPSSASSNSAAYPAGLPTAAGAAMAKMGNLKTGGTYTISADAYMPTAQIGVPGTGVNIPRCIMVTRRNAAGGEVALANSSQLANVAGAQERLMVTFTIPTSDITDLHFRLMAGTNNPTDVIFWDAVMIQEGATNGQWSEGIKAS